MIAVAVAPTRGLLAEEQAHLLRIAVEHSPAAVLITNRAGNIEYVNARFTSDTGYSADEVRGRNPAMLGSGLTARAQYETLWKTILSGQVYRGELRNRRKDGTLYWSEAQISPVLDGTGGITHFVGVQSDVTARRQKECALRESNARFIQLAENIHEVFFMADAQFREMLYINSAYEATWGRSRESIYQNPLSFVEPVLADDRERLLAHIAAVQRGEHPGVIEFRVLKPSGELRHVLAKAVPILEEAGAVYRISGLVLDVTERRETQAVLAETLDRFRAIIDTSFDAIAISQDGVIREVNQGFLKMFGLASMEEALGRSVVDFVADESRAETIRSIESHAEGTREFVGLRADGAKMTLEATTRSRPMNGRPARMTALRDLTAQRALEAQYLHAQKMEAVGRLSGAVAHDFNNLLTVIGSYAEILHTDLPELDPRRDDLDQIRKAAGAATSLTKQLLAFSRQQVTRPRVLTLEEVVANTRKMLDRVIGEDIALTAVLAASPLPVMADSGQLEQVIMNLAVNARDAMPAGGKLIFTTLRADVDDAFVRAHPSATLGTFAVLAVTDTGTGMDAATQAKIFEPFFTTKAAGKGTGLGLSTVYGIVQQSGGFILVDSVPDRGTTFKLYFPAASPAG